MATETVVKPRKRNDAYTGLLAISFLAFLGGCVLLYLDLQQYKEGDSLKKAPDPLKIDVPGAQLTVVPGSGTPPPPKAEMPPPEMPPPEMPPMMMMRAEPKKESAPVVLPSLETVDARPSAPAVEPVANASALSAFRNISSAGSVIYGLGSPVIIRVQATEPVERSDEPVIRIPDPLPVSIDAPTLQPEAKSVTPVTIPSLKDAQPSVPNRIESPM